jgi:hypothetical protein
MKPKLRKLPAGFAVLCVVAGALGTTGVTPALASGSCSGVGILNPTPNVLGTTLGQQVGSSATCTPRWQVLEHWQIETSQDNWQYVDNSNGNIEKQWFPSETGFYGAGNTDSWTGATFTIESGTPPICTDDTRIEAIFFNTTDGTQIHHQYSSEFVPNGC